MTNCKNCNEITDGNYCSNCGQAVKLHRIDGDYIMHEIQHVLHFEKGILFTIKSLLTKPGETVRHFITENRNRLVKPIIFVIITSLIYTFFLHTFHLEGEVKHSVLDNTSYLLFLGWMEEHYGYSNLIWGIFMAFWAKIFFRKYGYNFFEILVLLCFVEGIGMLILSVFAIPQNLTHNKSFEVISGVVILIYSSWAIGQFFDKKKWVSYAKSLAAYIFGMLTFFILGLLIGSLIDLVIKH